MAPTAIHSELPGSVLVVIDLQVGVLDGCFAAGAVVLRTLALVQRARDAGVPVVWVQHEEEDMPRGSDAWQLVAGLEPIPGEQRVCKTFCDAFADTPLRSLLERHGVRRLVIAGAQSDYCIRTTVQRAAVEGYTVTLVSDAHTTAACTFGGVTSSGEQIVAHTNRYFAGLRYPGVEIGLATHDAVAF